MVLSALPKARAQKGVLLLIQDLGDFAGARTNYERALKIFKKFLGDDHPNTRLVQGNLDALKEEEENKQKKSR
jgi:hypothetical protein